MQIPLRKIDSKLLHAVILIVKLLLIPVLALMFIAMDWKITYRYGFLFNATYIALLGDSFAGIIEFVVGCIRRSQEGRDRQPNADYYNGRTYSDEQLSDAIQGTGITILQDEYAKISDDLMLLGREDMSMGDQRKDWGEFKYQDTLLYVSSGTSGWMTPFRTEEHCEWELVTLKP